VRRGRNRDPTGPRSPEKRSAASEQGGWFRGGRADRCSARPGGYGAGGHPIGEDSRSPLCQGSRCCARGHGLIGTGEAPTGRRPQSPASGVFLSSAGTVRHGGRTRQSHYPAAIGPAHLLHAMPPVTHVRTEMNAKMSTERTENRRSEDGGGAGAGGDGRGRGAERSASSGTDAEGRHGHERARPGTRRLPCPGPCRGSARAGAQAESTCAQHPGGSPCAARPGGGSLRARRRRPRGCPDPR